MAKIIEAASHGLLYKLAAFLNFYDLLSLERSNTTFQMLFAQHNIWQVFSGQLKSRHKILKNFNKNKEDSYKQYSLRMLFYLELNILWERRNQAIKNFSCHKKILLSFHFPDRVIFKQLEIAKNSANTLSISTLNKVINKYNTKIALSQLEDKNNTKTYQLKGITRLTSKVREYIREHNLISIDEVAIKEHARKKENKFIYKKICNQFLKIKNIFN